MKTSIDSMFLIFLEKEIPYEVIVVAINGATEDGIPTEILFFTKEGGKFMNTCIGLAYITVCIS